MALSGDELAALLTDLESDRVERKESASDTDKASQAVCAFANDLPGHGMPGVLFVGVTDDGRYTGRQVTDELLRRLADLRDQGNILPPPSMSVRKVTLGGGDLAVVEVHPSSSPIQGGGSTSGSVRAAALPTRTTNASCPSAVDHWACRSTPGPSQARSSTTWTSTGLNATSYRSSLRRRCWRRTTGPCHNG